MRKKETITVEYKKPVHLFRDELLAIESILKQDLAGSDFNVSFDKYVSESISSIPTDQKLSNDVSFHISNPYFSIEVRRYSSRFYAAEDSLRVRGAIEKTKQIFDGALRNNAKVRQWIGRGMYGLSVLSGAVLIVTLFGYVEIFKDTFSSSKTISSMFYVLPLLCLISWGQMTWPLTPIIEFETRNNRKDFWEKNRDQIYVGLIVGVPTAIVSYLVGLLS